MRKYANAQEAREAKRKRDRDRYHLAKALLKEFHEKNVANAAHTRDTPPEGVTWEQGYVMGPINLSIAYVYIPCFMLNCGAGLSIPVEKFDPHREYYHSPACRQAVREGAESL